MGMGMCVGSMADPTPTHFDEFKQVTRELETDDDPERFKERLGKLAKHKPVEKGQ